MKNLICAAFSFKEGFNTSTQTGNTADNKTTITYLKNIFVTLTSAKLHNPDDDVVLFANANISEEWVRKLKDNNIDVQICPFDEFVIGKDFIWALAYYKLCVLSHVVKDNAETRKYDHILLMDTDTFTTRRYTDLWAESDFGVLMYQVGHDFTHPDRAVIREDFEKFYPAKSKTTPITHYGGEFVAGTQDNLEKFMETCRSVFATMTEDNAKKMHERAGDETIWSIAAALTDVRIINASPYIFRFWTGKVFYLVSNVTTSNPVCIWHVPNEKEAGFIRLYNYYQKNKEFPDPVRAAGIFGITKAKRPFNLADLLFRIKRKLVK